MLTFAVSAALAGLAAALVAPLNLVFPAMGDVVNLKAFAIIILGGMGSVAGAIAGGFLLALAEVMGGTYISSAFADLIGVGAALCLLVWALSPGGSSSLASMDQDTSTRVMADTNFVTAWVVMAFLAYELSVFAFDADIGALFQGWASDAEDAYGLAGCGLRLRHLLLLAGSVIPVALGAYYPPGSSGVR